MENNKYYIYIILCENDSYYTGITNNLIERFNKHKKGKGAKYTKLYKPIKFLSIWEAENISSALKIEHYIKKQDKKTKTLFIDNNRILKINFIKYLKEREKYFDKISIRSFNKKNVQKINNNIFAISNYRN